VTVSGEKKPSNWATIVDSITKAKVTGSDEYVPPSIRLFARMAEGPPSAPKVMTWPGDPNELAQASDEEANGLVLEGEQAKTAWKAIQESFSTEGETYWKAGDNFYYYVYASPIFPGIPEKD
jgi:hypothetical protein